MLWGEALRGRYSFWSSRVVIVLDFVLVFGIGSMLILCIQSLILNGD
jgi:hypothetical protein